MSYELIYTHAAQTLRAKRAGHGTVAMTQGLPDGIAELLESLSFPAPGEERVPTWSHIRLLVDDHPINVLSRITPSETPAGEPTILGHHVIVPVAERPAGGPAWLAQQPGFLRATWPANAPAEWLPAGPAVPQGRQAAGVCHQWAKLTGDAGWGGVLVEAFLREPRKAAYLLVPPRVDPLPLLAEALALLPEGKRWDVTFSTHHTRLPEEATCVWRCVPRHSTAARLAQRADVLVLDLAGMGQLGSGGPFVDLARTGQNVPTIPVAPAWPRDLLADEPSYVEPMDDPATAKRRQRAATLAAQAQAKAADADTDEDRPRRKWGVGWLMFLGLFFNVGMILLVAGLWWLLLRPQADRMPLAGGPAVHAKEPAKEPEAPEAGPGPEQPAPNNEPQDKKPAPVRPNELQGVVAGPEGEDEVPAKPGGGKGAADPGGGAVPPPVIADAPGGAPGGAPPAGGAKVPKPPGGPIGPGGPNPPDRQLLPGQREMQGGMMGLETPPVIPDRPAPAKPEGGGGGGLVGVPVGPGPIPGKPQPPPKGQPRGGPGGGIIGVAPGGNPQGPGAPPKGPAPRPEPPAQPPAPDHDESADPVATDFVELPKLKDTRLLLLPLAQPIGKGMTLTLWGLMGDDGQHFQTRRKGPQSFEVVQPAKSDLLDDVALASFSIDNDGLFFQWSEVAAKSEPAVDRVLRRCVLELRGGDQVRYIALAGPVVRVDFPQKAELLLNRGQLVRHVALPELPTDKWTGLHLKKVTVQFDLEPPLTLRPRRPGAELEVSHRVHAMLVTVRYEQGKLRLEAKPERGRQAGADPTRMLLRNCTLAARVGSIRVDVARYSFADGAP